MTKVEVRKGDYAEVLDDVVADLIFTSPPYNIGSKAPREDGLRKKGLYDPKSYGGIRDYPDTLPEQEYQDQQAQFLIWCAEHIQQNGVVVYNHKPRRKKRLVHPAEWFLRPEVRERLTLIEEVIWDRGSTHNHSDRLMWPHTERLYVFHRTDGTYRFRNTPDLVFRSDLWKIPLSPRTNGHACPFALELAGAVVSAWSAKGDLVCDPFAGSGTTAVAARNFGRNFVGAEKLTKYCKLATRRIEAA